MKCIYILTTTAAMALAATAANSQMTVAAGDHGGTVVETVTTPTYGTVTLTWAANANIAGGLRPSSRYWVPGINPDGSMPLSVANAFVDKLNEWAYLGITTWSLPITVYDDASCTLASAGGVSAMTADWRLRIAPGIHTASWAICFTT